MNPDPEVQAGLSLVVGSDDTCCLGSVVLGSLVVKDPFDELSPCPLSFPPFGGGQGQREWCLSCNQLCLGVFLALRSVGGGAWGTIFFLLVFLCCWFLGHTR